MADKKELLHLPKSNSTSLVISDAGASLIARGRTGAKELILGRTTTVHRAVVAIRKGEPLHSKLRSPRLYGVVDSNGNYVVDPIYKGIQQFSEGLAAYSTSLEKWVYDSPIATLFNSDLGLWGYLDHEGRSVIGPMFERARSFCEGLAAVAINGKWGFIRKDGSWEISPKYDGALDFKNGLALVKVGQKCGFINTSGEFAIQPQFDLLFEFSDGLACAQLNGRVGYIQADGKFAITPQFDPFLGNLFGATSFRYGVARVLAQGKHVLINRAGDFVFQCEEEWETIGDFEEGVGIVYESIGNIVHGYYIDSAGQKILRESSEDGDELDADTLDAVEGFREGLGVVCAYFAMWHHGELLPIWKTYADREDSRQYFGYVDNVGRVVIYPQFASAKPFREGFAAVSVDSTGKHGFIDRSGNLAIDPRFTNARDFSYGMAPIAESGKWGFVDRNGRIAMDCQFDWVEPFQEIPS